MVPRCDATSSQQQADLAGIVKVTVTGSFHPNDDDDEEEEDEEVRGPRAAGRERTRPRRI